MADDISVPTQASLTDGFMTGLKHGGVTGIGQAIGENFLGEPGLVLGGIAGAAALEGDARDRGAERAVERGVVHLLGASNVAASGGQSTGRGVM